MQQKLILINKQDSKNGTLYNFCANGKNVAVNEDKAKQLIASYPTEQRNCKISRGKISLKPYAGNLQNIQPSDKNKKNDRKIVHIYTKNRYRNSCYILNNNAWFINYMYDKKFIKDQADIIKRIDKATVIDYNLMTIVTPYGTTDITNLSAGLKTLLNVKYLKLTGDKDKKYLVSADDCGENIFPHLFDEVSNSNISLFISYPAMIPEGYTVYANDALLQNIDDFIFLTEED